MYNPFKPHIAQLEGGGYVVRRFEFFNWGYIDAEDHKTDTNQFWWTQTRHVLQHALFETQEEAQQALNHYNAHSAPLVARRVK